MPLLEALAWYRSHGKHTGQLGRIIGRCCKELITHRPVTNERPVTQIVS
jgi:hypothetical protein